MRKFLLGATLTYLGILLFLAGFLISTQQNPTLNNTIMTLIPLGMTAALLGVMIQILAALIAATGLLLSIASISKPTPTPNHHHTTSPNPHSHPSQAAHTTTPTHPNQHLQVLRPLHPTKRNLLPNLQPSTKIKPQLKPDARLLSLS